MPKVTSKADLTQGTEYAINLGTKRLTISAAGNITAGSTNGVAGKALYSSIADWWKSDTNANKYEFPFFIIDGPIGTMLEMRDGWEFAGASSIALLRDMGFAYRNTSDTITAEYANFIQAGSIENAADQPYYLLGADTAPTNFGVANVFNECIQIYGDSTHGNFNKRSSAQFYIRDAGDTYGYYDLLAEQDLTAATYRAYLVPMSTATDPGISTTTPSGAPYSGMTLTIGATTMSINAVSRNFAEGEIEANGGTVQQVYDWFQNLLLSTGDIDSGAGTQRGDTYGSGSLTFVGGVITTSQGLCIKNIASADASNIIQTDDTGTGRQQTFVPSITINCVDSSGSPANFATGTRVQIYNVTTAAELYNDTPGAVTGVSVSYSTGPGAAVIRYRLISVNGAAATSWIQGTLSISTANASATITQETNTVYNENAVDGSTVTECAVSGDGIDIFVDDPDNTTTGQRIYNWYIYYLSTEAGIRDSDDLIKATDQTHYIFDNTLQIRNVDTLNPLNLTGANIVPASGPATNIFDLSNGASIALNFNRVEGFSYSSGSGLSPEQATLLTNISNRTATMETTTDELHKLQGLDAANPMTVTPASRVAGSINQTISGDGTTTTTVTRT